MTSKLAEIETIAIDILNDVAEKRTHYREFGGQGLTPDEKRIRDLCSNIVEDISEFFTESNHDHER